MDGRRIVLLAGGLMSHNVDFRTLKVWAEDG